MLDTNIVIYAIKNRPQQIRECFKKHQGQMCLSTVTLGELIFGAERSQQVERNLADIEAMVARMEVLPLDNEAAVSAGISELKKKPMAVLQQGHGAPVVILNHDEPAFYAVPAEAYELLMDRLDDVELAEIVREREGQPEIEVDVDDL